MPSVSEYVIWYTTSNHLQLTRITTHILVESGGHKMTTQALELILWDTYITIKIRLQMDTYDWQRMHEKALKYQLNCHILMLWTNQMKILVLYAHHKCISPHQFCSIPQVEDYCCRWCWKYAVKLLLSPWNKNVGSFTECIMGINTSWNHTID